jgi:hypothetical protein
MSDETRRRLVLVSVVLFGLGAVLSWWQLVEQGPSTARWLTAGATTIAAVSQSVSAVKGRGGPRRRLLRRFDQ